ncbi:hypothetical protein, partial [Vibrio cidicii]|uniref:hypothetical protein n=1 Tax=Vibrio cidicii TaxID=1763883 RepID=UPI00267344F9
TNSVASIQFDSCSGETSAKLSAQPTGLSLALQKTHWLVVRDERVKPDFGQAFYCALAKVRDTDELTAPHKLI